MNIRSLTLTDGAKIRVGDVDGDWEVTRIVPKKLEEWGYMMAVELTNRASGEVWLKLLDKGLIQQVGVLLAEGRSETPSDGVFQTPPAPSTGD